MALQIVNPLEIPNWDDLVLATGKASFFHSSAWARVLHESYGYKPLYFASFEDGELISLMPFMEVSSWLTGKRGVSLPFTDQVSAIAPDKTMFEKLVKGVTDYGEKAGWKYIEWRDGALFPEEENASESHYIHELNLLKTERELFSGLRDSTRRNIEKANKAHVSVEVSQSLGSVKSFYRLNCITRKRHGLPPQPFYFFNKIFEHVLAKDHGFVVSATHSGQVLASAVFFHFGKSAIYKYAASDMAQQVLRPNNVLMWEAIKWCRENGLESFSFGITEPENKGLLQFKRGWRGTETRVANYRLDLKCDAFSTDCGKVKSSYSVCKILPLPVLRLAGGLLYRHLG
jgi:hypothetical protein